MTSALFWITRPAEDSAAVLAAMQRLQLSALDHPVMRMEHTQVTITESYDHLIITSKHACHALNGMLRNQPIWCVGSALAERLTSMGFMNLHLYPKASALLQDFTRNVKPPARILYLRGEIVRLDIADILRAQHYVADHTICYRSIGLLDMSPELRRALESRAPLICLFYAMQAARFTHALLGRHGYAPEVARIHGICMSAPIAEEAQRYGFRHVVTAAKADNAHMLESALAQQAMHVKLTP